MYSSILHINFHSRQTWQPRSLLRIVAWPYVATLALPAEPTFLAASQAFTLWPASQASHCSLACCSHARAA